MNLFTWSLSSYERRPLKATVLVATISVSRDVIRAGALAPRHERIADASPRRIPDKARG
jgi:hypothetical protein